VPTSFSITEKKETITKQYAKLATHQEVTSQLLTVLPWFRSDSNIFGICDRKCGTKPGVSPSKTNFPFPLRSLLCAIFTQLSSGVREVCSFGGCTKAVSPLTQRIITKAMLLLVRLQHTDPLCSRN
jgi:hypothetical protein